MSDLYDKDFYTWAMTQADAAKRRSANEVDWANVAEELESLGKSQASELKSRYAKPKPPAPSFGARRSGS